MDDVQGYCGTFYINLPAQSGYDTRIYGVGSFVDNTVNDIHASYMAAHHGTTQAITGIKFYHATGNFRTGASITVYGITQW